MEIMNIRNIIERNPHRYLTQAEAANVDLDQWEKDGRPCQWTLKDSLLVDGILYRAWYDRGHGYRVLSKGNDNRVVDYTLNGQVLTDNDNAQVVMVVHDDGSLPWIYRR